MVDCASRIEQFWSFSVTYADDQTGRIDNNSVRQASEDWREGAIGDEELRTVTDAWRAGCELADAVDILTVEARSDQPGQFTAAAVVPTPGTTPIDVTVEMTVAGASERITVTGSGTLTARTVFEVDSGGDYEICADVVSVAPA